VVQSGEIRKQSEAEGLDVSASHFIEPEEIFYTLDGIEVLVSKSWESNDTETGENDLQNLIDHVALYGIRVTKVEKKMDFNKGSYDIKVINPSLLNRIQNSEKKRNYWWIIILILLILFGLLFFFIYNNTSSNHHI
jgi:hypothetical protein